MKQDGKKKSKLGRWLVGGATVMLLGSGLLCQKISGELENAAPPEDDVQMLVDKPGAAPDVAKRPVESPNLPVYHNADGGDVSVDAEVETEAEKEEIREAHFAAISAAAEVVDCGLALTEKPADAVEKLNRDCSQIDTATLDSSIEAAQHWRDYLRGRKNYTEKFETLSDSLASMQYVKALHMLTTVGKKSSLADNKDRCRNADALWKQAEDSQQQALSAAHAGDVDGYQFNANDRYAESGYNAFRALYAHICQGVLDTEYTVREYKSNYDQDRFPGAEARTRQQWQEDSRTKGIFEECFRRGANQGPFAYPAEGVFRDCIRERKLPDDEAWHQWYEKEAALKRRLQCQTVAQNGIVNERGVEGYDLVRYDECMRKMIP